MSARGRPRLNRVGAGLEGARETAAARPPLRHRAPSSLPAARSAACAQTRYERPGGDRVPGGLGGRRTARRRGAAGPHPLVSGRSRGEGSARRAAGSEAPGLGALGAGVRRWRAGGAAPGAGRGRWATRGADAGRAANSHFGRGLGHADRTAQPLRLRHPPAPVPGGRGPAAGRGGNRLRSSGRRAEPRSSGGRAAGRGRRRGVSSPCPGRAGLGVNSK